MIGKKNRNLFNLIKKVGPIVAPSVNKQGIKPACSISESKNYFGNDVDFYLDVGRRESTPSTLVRFENGKIQIFRQGDVLIK